MKITLNFTPINGYVDSWEWQERFEEFYEKIRLCRQMKNGRPVDRKQVRELWQKHLVHVASYYVSEYWDEMMDVEGMVADMDLRDDKQ
jgi:hypothetical protein